ncbi:hypothetical protein PMAYCL1PPCAC_06224, partial [Pristionchus mayeri]
LEAGQAHLDAVLLSLLSSDPQQQMGENALSQLPSDQKANLLLKMAQSSEADEELRCSSLDRLSLLLSSVLHSWCSNQMTPFTDQMIQYALVDKNPKLRDKIDDILVLLVNHSLVLNSQVHASPALISFVQQSAAGNDLLQRSSLTLITRVPSLFGKTSDLRGIIEKCMVSEHVTIRQLALSSFFSLLSQKTIADFSQLLPIAIQV